LTLQSRITHESASTYFQCGLFMFCFVAEETASRRDSIKIQGIGVRYLSSLQIDPLVLLRARCIAPTHARFTWVSYQYITSWVGNTWSISEISSAPARDWTHDLWNGRPECYHSTTAPPLDVLDVLDVFAFSNSAGANAMEVTLRTEDGTNARYIIRRLITILYLRGFNMGT